VATVELDVEVLLFLVLEFNLLVDKNKNTKNSSPSKRSQPDINSRSSSQHAKQFYYYA
jgi:hypothetical protein